MCSEGIDFKDSEYKILQLVDSLDIGGLERMSVNIYNTLTENNIQNFLVVSRKSGPLFSFIENTDNVFFLNKKSFVDIFAFFKLLKLVKAFKPSIIHAHQTSIYWTFLLKIFYPKIKVIWHDHCGLSDLLKDSDRKLIQFFSFLMDGVICVNNKIKTWSIRNLKVDNKSIFYIPNYPFLAKVDRVKGDLHTLVCLANLRPQKDHYNLLEACLILKNENFEFKLLLAGLLEDVHLVKKIKKKIIEYGLTNHVDILGPVTNVSDLLGKSDVGVLSSVSEGLPVALLEYGLAGLPVVCTDVGQCREVLGNGEFGWLVPSKSPELFAKAIKEALKKDRVVLKKAAALKHNVHENYAAKGFLKKYRMLINSLQE